MTAAPSEAAEPPRTTQSRVEQTNPESNSDDESTGKSQSHTSTDSIRDQSPVKEEPFRDAQDSNDVSPDETQKTRKIGKTSASSQDKARRRALAQKALDK